MSKIDMNYTVRAHIFASNKCNCEGCPLRCNHPEYTCDKYNKYVKLYKEIAAERGKMDCVYALREFDIFLGNIVDCMPEWKDTIDAQKAAWFSTFKDRLYKKMVQ